MKFLKKRSLKALICSGFEYEFDESKCASCGGKCCVGESGYIWINEKERANLSKFLGLDIKEFERIFLYKVGNKFSIKEKPYENGFACVFFDEKNKNCGVYEFRPSQCRSFPFWEHFKENFDELERECIAVKHL